MTPLCAFCATAPMARWSFDEDKARPICAGCDDGSCESDEDHAYQPRGYRCTNDGTRNRVREALRRRPGMTATELREALGLANPGSSRKRDTTPEGKEAEKYRAALRRLVRLGDVVRRGEYPEFTYWPAADADHAREGRPSAAC